MSKASEQSLINGTCRQVAHTRFTRYWNFLREFIRNPREIGAICPSSPFLARHMANLVPTGDGVVVELGPGEGAVTSALLKRGIPAGDLVLVERSEALAQHLALRFPGVQIIRGDALNLSQFIAPKQQVRAIVSSLPLLSLPGKVAKEILSQISYISGPGTAFIQFSYALYGGGRDIAQGYELDEAQVIWRNLPPARVKAFSVRSSPIRHGESISAEMMVPFRQACPFLPKQEQN